MTRKRLVDVHCLSDTTFRELSAGLPLATLRDLSHSFLKLDIFSVIS